MDGGRGGEIIYVTTDAEVSVREADCAGTRQSWPSPWSDGAGPAKPAPRFWIGPDERIAPECARHLLELIRQPQGEE